MSYGSNQSLADRMREAMRSPGAMAEQARAAVEAGPESELFSIVQDQPFKAATVEVPGPADEVEVLYPAPGPRPPNSKQPRFVGPGEAMEIIATTPLQVVSFDSDSFPDVALVPQEVGSDIRPGR